MNTLTLTRRALGELPPDFQSVVAKHCKKFNDGLDLAIGEAALAWLSGKSWGSARGALRREHCAKYQAASRFNTGLDAVSNNIWFSFSREDEDAEDTQPRTRGEWVRHIAETRGVGLRRAQQIVAQALQALQALPGDGDGGAQLRHAAQGDLFGCDGSGEGKGEK